MKYVENYNLKHCLSGIIVLTVNTIPKNCYYHRYNDNLYQIGGNYKSDLSKVGLNISSDELGLDKNVRYYHVSTQDKHQITFLFIPLSMLATQKELRNHKINSVI